MVYSWHQEQWQQWVEQWPQLAHAWLLTGQENIGKTAFAQAMAQALLCEKPPHSGASCGCCVSCHLFQQGSHPDFYHLSPEQGDDETMSRKLLQIKIDDVRAVLEPLGRTSVRGGRRVVLITPAESMNVQAANALLKMLEEPPQAVVFLLVSHHKDRILPTIKSRCRQLPLPLPTQQQALDYLSQNLNVENQAALLAFHSGAPLFVPQVEQDALRSELVNWLLAPRLLSLLDYAVAYDKHKWPLALILDWLNKWVMDWALVQQKLPPRYYPEHHQELLGVVEKISAVHLFAYQKIIYQLMPYAYHSLNVRMQVEGLLSVYLKYFNGKA